MAKTETSKKVRLTLLRSTHGQLQMHRDNVRGLGLRRRHQVVEVVATPAVMGMVNASKFMFKIEESKS